MGQGGQHRQGHNDPRPHPCSSDITPSSQPSPSTPGDLLAFNKEFQQCRSVRPSQPRRGKLFEKLSDGWTELNEGWSLPCLREGCCPPKQGQSSGGKTDVCGGVVYVGFPRANIWQAGRLPGWAGLTPAALSREGERGYKDSASPRETRVHFWPGARGSSTASVLVKRRDSPRQRGTQGKAKCGVLSGATARQPSAGPSLQSQGCLLGHEHHRELRR